MKKIIIILFLITIVSLQPVFAQEKDALEAAMLSPTPVEYQLPYPGILPDNPLYMLKTLRDRIIDFLISDPLKKAEFNLLQADKRLASGIKLVEKQKAELAEPTISKGENYFFDAIVKVREAKKQGMDVSDIVRRLSLSAKKHKEVLQVLRDKVSKDLQGRFVSLEKRVTEMEKQVETIRSK